MGGPVCGHWPVAYRLQRHAPAVSVSPLLPQTETLSSASGPNSYLWQSFDYPTDVELPGAKIGRSKLADGKDFSRQFISKKSLVHPSPGPYSINIDPFHVVKVLEDGDLQTLGLLDYDKRLKHSFTAHPKVDPFTDEMFTFGYSHEPPYCTYRVITKEGAMLDPVPITIPESVMMHDFAITENYSIFMDLPLLFRPKEMVKNGEFIYKFDPTKKARFGILPRYAKDDKLIRWFELPNCFIFHNDDNHVLKSGLPRVLTNITHNLYMPVVPQQHTAMESQFMLVARYFTGNMAPAK
ncbi:unnamed protein product [Miscanthus lutarioriparius]|uniref:carotenoid 9,10-dioxygenase n=1 Tax=Miscanthus lutarioriparius TaxID=422564 RepID=A0A811PCJ2_9POAL|nr:unnamed protein product [Miscanthus lutarioriparius]